ncbi:hypothetical protein FNU76_09515 [Chitinimonas arctica]|uniref:Type 4 fimbrial biogenesis protein PilX N-terminal domain-containing protein n=1 Tax=Chitinimonas arctica TaxID=2594795 RepID=A0A516SEJ6_9NEIS|nr:PilX N-terminal domain-containing pilus assembly protein [Chitinimonas arctica]QDQ26589.1 hypothetical protein FNU76_09515 [Chitinimonas arctica]
MPNFASPARSRQSGFVLVISLIFLVALVVYVIYAMRVATLGERIAGNAKQRNTAFYAAQTALRRGEAMILAQEGIVKNNTGTPLTTVDAIPGTWSAAEGNTASSLECNLATLTANCGLPGESGTPNARWLITDAATTKFSIRRLRKGSADGNADYYVVTAIGYGKTTDTAVVLQQVVQVNT